MMFRRKKMYKPITDKQFSMIEIMLCLFVVVIGIMGVTALMPVGLDHQKSSISNTFAIDISEQFLRFNTSKIKNDWNWTNVFANSKPSSIEPSENGWRNTPIFQMDNIKIIPDLNFDSTRDQNGGFFLAEKSTNDTVEFSAIIRSWKELVIGNDGGKSAKLNIEVSWPAAIPYDSPERNKEVFTTEVSLAPEIGLDPILYNSGSCTVTRIHGNGFSTTISNVSLNSDSSYTIDLTVDYDGCTDAECLAISDYIVESNPGYTMDSIVGDGTTSSTSAVAVSGTDLYDGFKVLLPNGIGGDGVTGNFTIRYTLLSLQDQGISVKMNSNDLTVDFKVQDFIFVLNCSDNNEDPEFVIEGDEVIPSEDVYAEFKVLGSAIEYSIDGYSCSAMPVTVKAEIGSQTLEPWGDYFSTSGNVNDGAQHTYQYSQVIPAGTPISILSRSYWCEDDPDPAFAGQFADIEGNSSLNDIQVVTLRNGDQVPLLAGYLDQADAVEFLAGYLDANNQLVLEPNQAIYLFELGSTDQSSSAFDLQDLVLLVTLNKASN